MTIEQTIEVPANRQVTIEVPPQIPAGQVVLTFSTVSVNNDIEYAQKIWQNNNVHQEELKVKLQELRGSLGKNAFSALDGVAYQHKVRMEWDD